MAEQINLDSIAIIYDGDYLSSVPNTYKAFLELLRDKAGLVDEEFGNKTVWSGDFPITCKKDYIKAIRKSKDEGIMQIDLVSNELDEKEGIKEKDYLQFLNLKEPEEVITISLEEEDNKEETIYIESMINEFYALTQVTQYYKNNNDKSIELSIIYPLRKEINFRKFTINIDGKKSFSKIFEKEKAEEKYTDAIASGNVGIFSKYSEEDPNSYSITIGNVAPNAMVELTSEFVQFITSDDMSFCYSMMTSYPTFSDGISRNYLKNISGKINLKTHSKITRLVNKNFNIDKYFKRNFNEDNTECKMEFKIMNDSKNYNSILNIIFRTEKMNEPYLLSQYNPEKDETSYIFGMIHEQKQIPVPEKPDTDINANYYEKFETNEKTDTPSLFIFLVDQSGSMSGSSIKLVSESLLFFLQSLPKDSYFQIIGFGSTYKKINQTPLLYNKENVKNTMDIIKNLKADLGGTDISSPLNDIFKSKDYDEINLGRNLFILTDGEVDNREECLELISLNSDKFKVHAIGIGSSFDKILIQNAGIQGKGSYHFVNKVSEVNEIIIQSLSKCLRNYLLNIKLSLDQIKPEYEYMAKINFVYPDEILNYYFILKGKENENIQINFESSKKNESYKFSNEKIIKEENGEIVGQIIIGNILKNQSVDNLDENEEVKLSKNYQVLSKRTSLFAVAEGNDAIKIGEFKQIKKKEKSKINPFNSLRGNYYSNSNNYFNNNNNIIFNNNMNDIGMNFNNNNLMLNRFNSNYNYNNFNNNNYNNFNNNFSNSMFNNNFNANNINNNIQLCSSGNTNRLLNCECESLNFKRLEMEENENPYKNYNMKRAKNNMNLDMKINLKKEFRKNGMENEKEDKKENEEKEDEKKEEKEEKVEFNIKELILTQDIYEGNWNLNPQTKSLIEKEKIIYEKIEKIMKEKNVKKDDIKVTLLVLYYLNTDSSINKKEYYLIMKKAEGFLEKNSINFEEIFSSIKN